MLLSKFAFSVASFTMMSLELSGGMLDGFVGEIKCLSVAHQSLDDN